MELPYPCLMFLGDVDRVSAKTASGARPLASRRLPRPASPARLRGRSGPARHDAQGRPRGRRPLAAAGRGQCRRLHPAPLGSRPDRGAGGGAGPGLGPAHPHGQPAQGARDRRAPGPPADRGARAVAREFLRGRNRRQARRPAPADRRHRLRRGQDVRGPGHHPGAQGARRGRRLPGPPARPASSSPDPARPSTPSSPTSSPAPPSSSAPPPRPTTGTSSRARARCSIRPMPA